MTRSALPVKLALVTLLVQSNVSAHPGHHHFSEGILHAVTSGYHIASLAVLAVACLIIGQAFRHRAWGLKVRMAGVACAAFAGLLWMAQS